MNCDGRSRFRSEYEQGLARHMAWGDEDTLPNTCVIGGLAHLHERLPHEIVAVHCAALFACVPRSGATEFALAAEFLVQSLEAFQSKLAKHRGETIKRAAHELRTPLTTLRLALQVGLGRLEKGDTLEPSSLWKALAQVDKLTVKISELLAESHHLL